MNWSAAFSMPEKEVNPMPKKPKKPCAYPGCPKLTDGLYCEEHKTKANQQYERYGRKYKKNERYGSAWQKVRARYVKLHPFCEECFAQGILTRVEHVHHIKPLDEGGTNDFDNLKSLCQSCHSRIHALRGDYWHK